MATYTKAQKREMQLDSLEWLKNKFILNNDYKIYYNSQGKGFYQVFIIHEGMILRITAKIAKSLLLKYNPNTGFLKYPTGGMDAAHGMTDELKSLLEIDLYFFYV